MMKVLLVALHTMGNSSIEQILYYMCDYVTVPVGVLVGVVLEGVMV